MKARFTPTHGTPFFRDLDVIDIPDIIFVGGTPYICTSPTTRRMLAVDYRQAVTMHIRDESPQMRGGERDDS